MVLPVLPHRLTKIHPTTRRCLIKAAVFFSTIGCITNTLGVLTNNWLYTSELLRYYVPPGHRLLSDEEDVNASFYKNATLGPWLFCWLDPDTDYHCTRLPLWGTYDEDDAPADITSAVQQSTHRASAPFMIVGYATNVVALASILLVSLRSNPYRTLFAATIVHILVGLLNFACIIVYMASLAREAGQKVFAAFPGDEARFRYAFGYSFILLKASFFATQLAALFSVLVFMSKLDERTYNRYQISTLLKAVREGGLARGREALMEENLAYHQHSRMAHLHQYKRPSMVHCEKESAAAAPESMVVGNMGESGGGGQGGSFTHAAGVDANEHLPMIFPFGHY